MESKTIEFKQYTLTVYENGDVYRHKRTLIIPNGKRKTVMGKMMTSSNNGRGYLKLGFKIKGKAENEYVHKIVALAFHPNPLNMPCVNHIDGNKSNNSAANLEWCTHKENTAHAIETGLYDIKNEKSHFAKLNRTQVLEIVADKRSGPKIAADYGTTHKNVSNIKRGVSWSNITGIVYTRKKQQKN
jgi:hypothetical protein